MGITNQLLAATTLWACAVYLVSVKKNHLVMSIPAVFITYVSVCYLLVAPNKQGGLHMSQEIGMIGGAAATLICAAIFYFKKVRK